jgi:hypothetical protein
METNRQYYARRAAEEMRAAARAASPEAETCHRILAHRYSAIVDGQDAGPFGETMEHSEEQ